MAKNYKLTLCSNRKCKKAWKKEKYTFVAPDGDRVAGVGRVKGGDKTIIARFCSMECKVEWLRNEYNRNIEEYNAWVERLGNQKIDWRNKKRRR